MVELLMVIIIIGILIALLLPAINAAVRTARQAAVQAEISQLAAALESFKARYGDYPPSRVYLNEAGNYLAVSGNAAIPGAAPNDITLGQLAQRSLVALRKFFPKVLFSTQGPVPLYNVNTYWYDFNGNGVPEPNGYILQGHECLVFFLGGVPQGDNPSNPLTFGMTGFGNDPTNPFSNNIASDSRFNGQPNPMYRNNRQPPLFEFNPGRLYLDPNNLTNNGGTPGIPGYYDSLGNAAPVAGGTTVNFYAYFSAYGNGPYDPNDVNFGGPAYAEADTSGNSPIWLQFHYGTADTFSSPAPNPYSTTLTAPTATSTSTGTVTFQKAQTYQILSPGLDGLYGVGGQYLSTAPMTSSAGTLLPFDTTNTLAGSPPAVETDTTIRQRERDNLTNFKSGTLQ
jgi:type II secretory pathway pseudopilin PulG